MATYLQAVTISLPNAALLRIQGTLSMADEEGGWNLLRISNVTTMTMAGWLAGRYDRGHFQLSIAIFAFGLVLTTRVSTVAQRERCQSDPPGRSYVWSWHKSAGASVI